MRRLLLKPLPIAPEMTETPNAVDFPPDGQICVLPLGTPDHEGTALAVMRIDGAPFRFIDISDKMADRLGLRTQPLTGAVAIQDMALGGV